MGHWILNKKTDLLFILLPGILSVIFIILGNELEILPKEVSPLVWLIFVLGIDVCHVWSTLFRTYLNKFSRIEFEKELVLVPILVWASGTVLYSLSSKAFWTLLAYIAVFHFVKQQVGILKLYQAKQKQPSWIKSFDVIFIYSLMVLPIIYWHTTPRKFQWFVENDFFNFHSEYAGVLIYSMYFILILSFIIKEIFNKKLFNLAKTLHLLSTGLVWYFGIVFYNNDVSFTVTNIVHHGIPYFCLIWISCMSSQYTTSVSWMKWFFSKGNLIRLCLFVGTLVFLGYFEEFLWDTFVWQEHSTVFFKNLYVELDSLTLTWLVPLLTLPQATHYVLDGYIWKKDRKVDEFLF